MAFRGFKCDKCKGEVEHEPDCTVIAQYGKPLDAQIGGNHYKDMKIQPIEYIVKNNIGFAEGSIVKYVSRWKAKNGIEDLRKAKHFIELLIEMETQ